MHFMLFCFKCIYEMYEHESDQNFLKCFKVIKYVLLQKEGHAIAYI